ncbi:MAG: serine/threonine-protein kinase, partial [Myxococcota bacterium]
EKHLLGSWLGGKYAVLGLLGSGGVGTVYWGIQHPIGRRVAIKVLRSGALANAEQEERFLREARAAARMNHPNVITCYDYGLTPNRVVYMVLEFIEGTSLETFIQTQRLERDEVIWVARRLLEGIGAFHKANIIHRDIKPDNVMLAQSGHGSPLIKIIDFGLVRYLQTPNARPITQHGEILGTPVYMSPEQAMGEPVTLASDVYTFGTVLYELLSGRPPFESTVVLDLLLSHAQEQVPPLPDTVPEPLREYVYRCLDKDPAVRFSDGAQALDALNALELAERPLDGKTTSGLGRSASIPPNGAIQLELDAAQLSTLGGGSSPVPPTALTVTGTDSGETSLGVQWRSLLGATALAGGERIVQGLEWIGANLHAFGLAIWRTHQALARRLTAGVDAVVLGDPLQRPWRGVRNRMDRLLPALLLVGNINFFGAILATVGLFVWLIVDALN